MADIISAAPAHAAAHGHDEKHYLNDLKGLKSWLLTVDHKRIGVMYLWLILAAFFIGGVFAMLVRLELLAPGKQFLDAEQYNRVFTLHGVVMVFLFIIPSVPAALGNFVLPLMLGAKDVAFPRLNLASWYIYIVGAAMALSGLVVGGIDTGWTFYTPYSTSTQGPVTIMTLAVFVLGFSSIFTGINFIATVHKLRAPGMTWYNMPLFVWGMYATSLIQVLATPVVGITLLLLVMERAFQIGIFDPRIGGDPVLFQHFFWFFIHPAVYIMILPGMAIISEIIPTFSKKTIFGYKGIAFSSVAIALVGFFVWGHHMFVAGQTQLAGAIFSFLTFLVAIPSAIKVFNWITTMYKGHVTFEAPMLYALSFLLLFAIGGLTGLFLGTLSIDVHLHDTYFVVAHFHYVMMGGTVIAFIGGLHYWWPKMFGRMYNEKAAAIGAALIFIGFNVTFLSQFILGSRGMPRRYYNYLDQFQPLHAFSTYGSWILGLGLMIAAINLFATFRKKMDAPANPWGAATMEWTDAGSPPVTHNFHHQPVATHGPYDYFPGAEETLMSSQIQAHGSQAATHGLDAHANGHSPFLQHHFAEMKQQFDASKIGMWLFLVTEILLFGGLFVGFGIMQTRYPEAFYEAHHHLDRSLGALNTVVLLVSSFTMVMAVHSAQTSQKKKLIVYLVLTLLCAAIFLGVKYFEYGHKIHDGLLPGKFYSHKSDAVAPAALEAGQGQARGQMIFFSFYFMMTGLHGIHIVGGMVVIGWILLRAIRGDFSSAYYTPVDLVGLYWHLVDLIWIYLFPLLYLIS